MELTKFVPWSLRGVGPFLNTYGDKFLFGKVGNTKPIKTNPDAETSLHSAVPHRYLYAYLIAAKSLLRYHNDYAVFVHDDGSLTTGDKELIERHLPGAQIVDRQEADEHFRKTVDNSFLSKVRGSYTSYLKLFDTTLYNKSKRIIILDTDTLFLKRPEHIIDWSINGGKPWFHMAPRGKMKQNKEREIANYSDLQKVHIQTLIMQDLEEINSELNSNYRIEQGFCSGFIGYDADTIDFDELNKLFSLLHRKFGDKVFRWGAEQTTHGLVLCSKGATALPLDDYFVFTQNNAKMAKDGTFVHFVGENRFYKRIYPKLANDIIKTLP
jgi:hypothetical protein